MIEKLTYELWQGSPLALAPYREDTSLETPDKINNFDYTEGPASPPNCRFAAHVRKVQPRQLNPLIAKDFIDSSVMVRSSIPYGEDVSHFQSSPYPSTYRWKREYH
jgi:deferrochelatase/peroxidase EfeB